VVAVAQRYRVSKAQVAQWNSVPLNASFAPGQTIVVMQAGSSGKGAKTNTPRMAAGKSTVASNSQAMSKTRRHVGAP
jgi:hypothetical protein